MKKRYQLFPHDPYKNGDSIIVYARRRYEESLKYDKEHLKLTNNSGAISNLLIYNFFMY
jgi:hypothetical protein